MRTTTNEATISAHEKAHKNAKALAKRLHKSVGGRWSTLVWENMGWHYSVSNDEQHLDIHSIGYDGKMSFMAFLQISGPWGGNLVEHGTSPEAAIKTTLHTAKQYLKPVIGDYLRLAQ